MIKAVIFDMFETLVTHYRSQQYFGEDIAKDLGITEEKFREIWDQRDHERSVGLLTFEDVIQEIMEKNGIRSETLLNQVSQRRTKTKVEVFMHLHEEILPLLAELKRRNIKIGLISNCFSEEVFAIRGSKLYPYFDASMLSYEQGVMKPDKEIYSRCLKKLNVSSQECLYVGDGGSKELETATEMGMKALQATWYFEDNTRDHPKRDLRFPALESPREILHYLFFFTVLFGTREPLHFREYDRQGIDLELQMQFRGSVGVYGYDVDHFVGERDISQAVREQAQGIIQYGLDHWAEEKSVMQCDVNAVLRQMLEKGLAGIGIKAKTESFSWQLTEESQKLYSVRIPFLSEIGGGDGKVQLKPVTKENLDAVLALRVEEGQEGYVSSTAESLAQAYVYADTAYPFGIYDGDELVGFIMMGYYEAKQYYTLWKFMIDRRFQNKGYGRQALKLGLDFVKDRFGAKEIYTGVTPGNTVAKRLYESVGFRDTGLLELGMEEMKLTV